MPTDSSLPRQAAQSDISGGTGARLPKLDLMRFDGSPMKWLPFWDLCRHSVHENPCLNNVDRFHFLRSLPDGPAAKAIVGVPTTDNSYDDAVSMLEERFEDVRMTEQRHLKNLRTLRPVTTSANASALRSLYDFCSNQHKRTQRPRHLGILLLCHVVRGTNESDSTRHNGGISPITAT